ncbi:DNA polymerase III subunit gamma/tau domain-containing protein [Herbidospora sp. RD11066]
MLIVVALGMRSMNRRESALSSERIKAMAEGAAKKKGSRPAEETFFESFPEGFDAFEEPSKKPPAKPAGKPAGPPRPGSRQGAKPPQRGAKAPAGANAPRGKRGVDEWGSNDDYDDDYWSRVRADDGAFGGTIRQRMATPRPVEPEPAASTPAAPAPVSAVDPNAATVQGVLPQRPAAAPPVQPLPVAPVPGVVTPIAATLTPGVVTPITGPLNTGTPSNGFFSPDTGRVDGLRATPSSQLAEQKTVTFSAPTPDLTSPATGPFTPPGASTDPFAAGPSTGMFETRPGAYDQPPTGPFPSRPGYDTGYGSGSFPAPQPEPIPPAYPEPTGWPVQPAPSYPQPPAGSTPPAWGGSGDVFDDPQPLQGSNATWAAGDAAGYQMPAPPPSYNDFSTGAYQTGNIPATPAPGSYEVSAGWATIDDSDSVAGAYGYDQQGYPGGAVPPGQPAPPQNTGGSWPSYDELYPEQTTRSGGGRRGTHRNNPETDQPDYYR